MNLLEAGIINSESGRSEVSLAKLPCEGKLPQDELEDDLTEIFTGSDEFTYYSSLPNLSPDLAGRRASSACGSHWQVDNIADWDLSSIGTGVDIQSTETVTNRTVKDDSCNIPVGQADINPSNIDFVTESCEGNIVSTVLNKTLDIIDSVVAVVDDIEKSRKEPYLCSTRQLKIILM